jgi:RNA polymerase sigma-70 factor (ECF subfamily)
VHPKETDNRFLELIEENRRLISKICLFYSKTPSDRQDLFQEIVLQAWKGYPQFRHDSKFSTWLYMVSLNTALTHLKKQKKNPAIPASDIEIPELAQSETEQQGEMYAAIDELNEIEKSIVLLYLDSYSYDEMEKILGISNGTLRVKMSRIKQKLKTIIK